jgi:hypothetical protein
VLFSFQSDGLTMRKPGSNQASVPAARLDLAAAKTVCLALALALLALAFRIATIW